MPTSLVITLYVIYAIGAYASFILVVKTLIDIGRNQKAAYSWGVVWALLWPLLLLQMIWEGTRRAVDSEYAKDGDARTKYLTKRADELRSKGIDPDLTEKQRNQAWEAEREARKLPRQGPPHIFD